MKRISVLTPDLSGNGTGRAWLLAKLLAERFEVELVGARFGETLWQPLQEAGMPVVDLPFGAGSRYAFKLASIAEAISGDLIVASKPLATSYGAALIHRKRHGTPILLDIDDWESGFCLDRWQRIGWGRRLRYLASSLLRPHGTLSLLNASRYERRRDRAQAITVSNRFLQRRFGGELIWHARDTDRFAPEAQDGAATRRRFGIESDRRVVTFLGTITPYKGLTNLIEAVASLGERSPLLWLVGVGEDPHSREVAELAERRLGSRVRLTARQPLELAPQILAASDVVAIPQSAGPATRGQMPAKLFDAMAAGRPLVSTDVSDIAEVVGEAGWIVEPDDIGALAGAIEAALVDRDEAERRGRAARARAIAEYGWAAMAEAAERAVSRAAGPSADRANDRAKAIAR